MSRRLATTWALAGLVGALGLLAACSSLPKSPDRVTALETTAWTTYQAGLRQYHEGRYEQAVAYFERALALHASVDHRTGTVQDLTALGRAHLARGEQAPARAAFMRAKDACRGLRHPDLEAQVLGGLAAAALADGELDQAHDLLRSALALPLAEPGPERAVLRHDLGVVLYRQGDAVAAEEQLRAALAMHEDAGDHQGIAAACHALARLRAAVGDPQGAMDLALRALARDRARENPPGVAGDLMLLGELSRRLGRDEDAASYYRRAELAWTALGRADLAADAARQATASPP